MNSPRISAIEIFSSTRLNMFLNDFAKVELKSALSDLTFNNIIRMVAGKRFYGEDMGDEGEARQFRELIGEVFEYGGATNPGDFVPLLNWINGNY
ncbi:hypothetical protein CRYUN_Cryun04dG0097500 [Craigia yunnanensis]